MKLALDTDAFCKLGAADLLEDTATWLVGGLCNCERLPSLPYMLRRGGLARHLGPDLCRELGTVAESLPALVGPLNPNWIEILTAEPAIDPGEAMLFARAADPCVLVLSADKRALNSLKSIHPIALSLSHRVIVLEAVLLFLCNKLGERYVRQRIGPLRNLDRTVKLCFSDSCIATEALHSYFLSLTSELAPIQLWRDISWTGKKQ